MLKILQVVPVAERGGLEVVLLNILIGLDRTRFLSYAVLLEDGPFVGEVKETGAVTHVFEAGRVRNMMRGAQVVVRLVRLIKDEGIAIVHSHNAKAHLYGGLAAKIAGIPSVYHLHGVPRPALTRDGIVSVLAVAIPAWRTIACSRYVAEEFTKAWPGRRKVSVIHNGLQVTKPETAGAYQAVRQELGIPETALVVLMAARLQFGKGIHIFLDAAARVSQQSPETRFIIVGGALFGLGEGYAQKLRQQTERLGISNIVRFTGYRPDVARFLAAADVVVHSGVEPDSFPTVLLEAMAFGKPVVAADLGGPNEIVTHGVTGLLVPPGRPDLQARAILSLLDSAAMRRLMGEAAEGRFLAEFQSEQMTKQLEELYLRILGE